MNWRKPRTFVLSLAVLFLCYMAVVEHVTWAHNIFVFLTWVTVVAIIMNMLLKESNEMVLQSYRDNKHLPLWMDNILYAAKIIILVINGWMFFGVLWLFIWSVDVAHREQAKERSANAERNRYTRT